MFFSESLRSDDTLGLTFPPASAILSAGVTGNVVGSGRYVDIVGTMKKNALLQGVIPLSTLANSYIKPEFVRRGWSIGSVDLTWNGSTQRYQFRITAWVRNEFSNAEIVNGAKSALLGVTQGVQQAFSDVYVELQQTNNTVGGNTGGSTGNVSANNPSGSLGTFFDNLGSGLGSGLGISSPVVLLLGAGLLVLILRR